MVAELPGISQATAFAPTCYVSVYNTEAKRTLSASPYLALLGNSGMQLPYRLPPTNLGFSPVKYTWAHNMTRRI